MYEQGTILGSHPDFSALANRGAFQEGSDPIHFADFSIDPELIANTVARLDNHEAWNLYGPRKEFYGTPHLQMADLWVRYNAWENFDPDKGLHAFNTEHVSSWYAVAHDVPELGEIVDAVIDGIDDDVELGGVLITRIPPGGEVAPHRDAGWHAEYYYDKYAVQLQGNSDQSFNFDGHSLSPEPGEVFWFNNQEKHWVYNNSNEDRMTMIICVRPKDTD